MTCPGTALFLGLDYHPQADHERFDARRTGLDHLALRLQDRSDLDAWVARLDALGAAVLVHDPDGIPIELFWSAA